MKKALFILSLEFLLIISSQAQVNVTYTINTGTGRTAISPYVYGNNMVEPWSRLKTENVTARRLGGNRTSTYNWEHNFSNAGIDYGPHSTDTYLFIPMGIPVSSSPGRIVTAFHDTSLVLGTYSLVTIPAGGYVSRNTTKFVTTNPPSADWDRIQAVKGSAFTLTPTTTDGVVYTDEFLNFLINRFGTAATANGIKGYSVDNEPDLWNSTHSRMHSAQATCQEIVDKNIEVGKVVKQMDPAAEVFGFVSYGYQGLRTCQNASDWSGAGWSGTYPWYVDAFLDKMRIASNTEGKRLLDVLDFHFYSEHMGADNGGTQRRVYSQSPQTYDSHNGVRTARMQAPRSLWDPTFTENSWITLYAYPSDPPMQLIPNFLSKIAARYPGTKLSITEYDFGAEDDISGGIATADALGVFGKHGLYMANYWGEVKNYVSLAFKLYRNYDGNKSTFENTSVTATTSSLVNSTIYGSVNSASNGILHLVVTNKNLTNAINGTFTITSSSNYTTAKIYGFQNGSASISLMATVAVTGNSFTYNFPALSALHIVLQDPTALPVKIKSFTGHCNPEARTNDLYWETEEENGITTYDLEKSSTGEIWTKIASIEANHKPIYGFSDNTKNENAVSYYRLRTNELNGTHNYSPIVPVRICETENISYTLFPNPFKEGFSIQCNYTTPGFTVTVKDLSGNIVEYVDYSQEPEKLIGEHLSSGIYFIEIQGKNEQVKKIYKLIKTN
jgi:hypothetical protein